MGTSSPSATVAGPTLVCALALARTIVRVREVRVLIVVAVAIVVVQVRVVETVCNRNVADCSTNSDDVDTAE